MLVLITILLLALLCIATVCAAILGWKLGSGSKLPATLYAGADSAVLIAGALCAWHCSWLPECFISRITCYLQGCWFVPPAAILFFIQARQSHGQAHASTRQVAIAASRRQTRLLGVLTAAVLFAGAHAFVGPLDAQACLADIAEARANSGPRIDKDGVVHQSVGYTCGAAACATLLRRMQIDPNASEEQMVKLCLTRRLGGTTTLGMAAGLKTVCSTKGWQVRILEPGWEDFCRLPKPVVCSVLFSPGIGHAVVVCAIDERGVQVADPIGGLSWWPQPQFQQAFLNEAVAVYK